MNADLRSCACAPGSAWNGPTASPTRPASRTPAPRSTQSPKPRRTATCPRTSTPVSCLASSCTWPPDGSRSAPNSRPPSTFPTPKNAPATSRTPSAPCSASPPAHEQQAGRKCLGQWNHGPFEITVLILLFYLAGDEVLGRRGACELLAHQAGEEQH